MAQWPMMPVIVGAPPHRSWWFDARHRDMGSAMIWCPKLWQLKKKVVRVALCSENCESEHVGRGLSSKLECSPPGAPTPHQPGCAAKLSAVFTLVRLLLHISVRCRTSMLSSPDKSTVQSWITIYDFYNDFINWKCASLLVKDRESQVFYGQLGRFNRRNRCKVEKGELEGEGWDDRAPAVLREGEEDIFEKKGSNHLLNEFHEGRNQSH